MKLNKKWHKTGVALALAAEMLSAHAGQTLCVFDVVGATGDAANMAKDYALAMQKNGASIALKVYTNEGLATADFSANQCDALLATAFRTRPFNGVAAATDTLGSTNVMRNGKVDMAASYEVLRQVAQTFASPQAAALMVDGAYEVGGLFPYGAAYPMVNDRALNTVEALAGKKIAAFDYDAAQALMIQRIGGQAVSADISTFSAKFKSGEVDMIAAPTMAYKPLELSKGIGAKGGIARFPLMILTYQLILQKDKFPAGFGEKSRNYWVSDFDRALQLIKTADAGIPAAVWIDLSPENVQKYNAMLRDSRIEIAGKGVYDKRGLKVIKKVRCAASPTEAECANKSDEG